MNRFQGALRHGFVFPLDTIPKHLCDESWFVGLHPPDLAAIGFGQPVSQALAASVPFAVAFNNTLGKQSEPDRIGLTGVNELPDRLLADIDPVGHLVPVEDLERDDLVEEPVGFIVQPLQIGESRSIWNWPRRTSPRRRPSSRR